MKDYLSIDGSYENEIVIERSRFIAYVSAVDSADEAQKFIDKVKKDNPFATHNCYAYICNPLGSEMKFSDDGEPQCTAGQPMLEVLRKKRLTNIVVVVTRFFGGVKLGAGGLVSAYTRSVAECLDIATTATYKFCEVMEAECDYSLFGALQQLIQDSGYIVLGSTFEENVKISFAVPETDAPLFLTRMHDVAAGKVLVKTVELKYIKF